jgi:hypothetical protein
MQFDHYEPVDPEDPKNPEGPDNFPMAVGMRA